MPRQVPQGETGKWFVAFAEIFRLVRRRVFPKYFMRKYSANHVCHTPPLVALSEFELDSMFASEIWGLKFPPVLTVDQAAELLQVPKRTIYDWSSRGLLKSCSRRVGKRLRILRNRLIVTAFQKGLSSEEGK